MARRKKKRPMTDLSFTQLPLMAGSAVANSAGRIGGWTLSRYMRAPLASTAILAMVVLSIAGAAHAIYFEHGKHPAPLFKPTIAQHTAGHPATHAPAIVAPQPAPRPASLKGQTVSSIISGDTTGSLPSTSADAGGAVGNRDVAAVQRKLAQLNFFKADVDGYYGPKTAEAIRAFEQQVGMKPVGSLDKDVIQAILSAPMVPARTAAPVVAEAPAPVAPPPAQLAAAPAVQPVAQPQPAKPLQLVGQGGAEPNLHPEKLALGPAAAQPLPPPAAHPVADAPAPAEIHMVSDAQPMPAAPASPVAPSTASMPLSATGPTTPAAMPLAQNPADRLLKAADRTASTAIDTVTGLVGDVTGSTGASAAAPAAAANPNVSTTDPRLVTEVQRGLASLGFLAGQIDGVANESTAKAIRNFEVYYDYPVTGRVSPELVGLLKQAGAVI
jgi:peptidoglycan hydrolase-like protein with peptidoglycan-binding domain